MFKPDIPIECASDDLLSRTNFAYSLGDALLGYKDKHSVVVGLYGEWGSGKSSVINMVLERIQFESESLNKNDVPVVIKFNPWNYSDQNQLVAQFFRELSVALKRKDFGEDARKAGEQLEVYANFFTPLLLVTDPTGISGILAQTFPKVANLVGKAAKKWGENKSKDLAEVRKSLDELLAKQTRKIIIVIDDIDRLNNAEIRQVFQLVKSLGDFPNSIYLLSFDRDVVEKALAKVQEGPGIDYLEKIVQIPFQLPIISREDVEKLLFNQLTELLHIPDNEFDSTYWGNVYHSGLKDFFTNVRDVTRYINSLRFSYKMVENEVDPIDFMAISALQVFEPDLYVGIRDNKDVFSGMSSDYSNRGGTEQAKARCDEILNRAKILPFEKTKEFLQEIFPKLDSIYGNMGYSHDHLQLWRRKGNICSPEIFDVFFRLSVPKGEMSLQEINSILSLAKDEEAFASALIELNSIGKITVFLDRFQDYTEEVISPDDIGHIVNVFMDIGDFFPDERKEMFGTENSMRILRIFHQLTKRLEGQDKRYQVLKTAIEKSTQSLYTMVHQVGVKGQEHGKFTSNNRQLEPEENRTVSGHQLFELEQLVCARIKAWAKDGRLEEHPKLPSILFSWKGWSDDEENDVIEYVAELVKSDSGLIKFITSFLSKSFSHSGSDKVTKVNWRMSLDSIRSFISIDDIEARIRALRESKQIDELAENARLAITTFLDIVDGKIKDW